VRAALIDIENAMRQMNNSESTKGVKAGAFEDKRKELKARLAQTEEEAKKRLAELSQTEQALSPLGPKIATLTATLETMRQERDSGRKRITEIAPKELSARLKALQAEIVELTGQVANLRSEKDTSQAELGMVRQRHEEALQVEAEAKERIARLRKQAKESQEKESRLTVELNGLKRVEESMGNEMKGLRDRRDRMFKEKTQLEAERDKALGKIETAGDISIGMTTKLRAAEDRMKEVEAELAAFTIKVDLPLPTLEELKETIAACERRLGSMGAVNLKAVEDYDSKRTRHTELRDEAKRLEEQRKDLIKLMEELNQKKKLALSKVFVAINENFKLTYAELSGGGEAELVLENPESPFEGGLIMKVRPRLGKVLRLDALSGGEKSLAALAFIFAIQQYQPSPFYLLDEVDMFLDAVNADMVAHRVVKCARTAQFVQISLRKVTLSKADHIIGVTKGEGGISHVIMRPNLGDIKDLQEELIIPDEKAEQGEA